MDEVTRYERLLRLLDDERSVIESELKVLLQDLRRMETAQEDVARRLELLTEPESSENLATEMRVLRSADARLRSQIQEIDKQIASYEQTILAPVRARLKEATIRCKTMEKLIEKKRAEAALEAQRKENALLDEMGSMRWRQRQESEQNPQ